MLRGPLLGEWMAVLHRSKFPNYETLLLYRLNYIANEKKIFYEPWIPEYQLFQDAIIWILLLLNLCLPSTRSLQGSKCGMQLCATCILTIWKRGLSEEQYKISRRIQPEYLNTCVVYPTGPNPLKEEGKFSGVCSSLSSWGLCLKRPLSFPASINWGEKSTNALSCMRWDCKTEAYPPSVRAKIKRNWWKVFECRTFISAMVTREPCRGPVNTSARNLSVDKLTRATLETQAGFPSFSPVTRLFLRQPLRSFWITSQQTSLWMEILAH